MDETIRLQQVLASIDAANAADPNPEVQDAARRPKELVYGERMSEMLGRFAPQADAVQQIAVRAQHIRRWEIPRNSFPMTREGYLQWRTRLYKFHAEAVAALMREAAYDAASVARVEAAVGKRGIKVNPDSQLLEDIAGLVFIEHYMHGFATQHPEYDEAKWLGIIRKTWQKMSEAARAFALGGHIRLPEGLVPLIQKAIA